MCNWLRSPRRHEPPSSAPARPSLHTPASRADRQDLQALAWLDTEYPNLTAVTHAAADSAHHTIARDLPQAMWNFLLWRRHFNDWITLSQTALTAAHALGDQHGQARALNSLGVALREVRRFEEAITAHQTAAQIHRDTGNRHGEGMALNNLGLALRRVRRFEEAITAYQHDLQICRDLGDRHGEGQALGNLGIVLQEVGRFEEAITAHQQAAQIFRDTDDQHSEAIALQDLQETTQAQNAARPRHHRTENPRSTEDAK